VAYQTAYLKAHYPAEYMAAVMTSAQSDIKRVTELMEDCRKHGVEVAAPSVNHSDMDFSVDSDGRIRFGLQAISGMGESASAVIIEEREKNGPYKDVFDFLKRIDLHAVNRKNVEVLVKAGAFDGVGSMHRAQYLYKESELDNAPTYLDILFRWALRRQESASVSQMSIFDMDANLAEEEHPPVPEVEPWNSIQRCQYEKEVISTYLSGHPLDDYKYEMQYVVNTPVAKLNNLDELAGRDVRFAGMVSAAKDLVSKKGEPFGSMMIDDYSGSYKLSLFGDEYSSFSGFFKDNTFVYVKATVFSKDYVDKSGISRKYTKIRIGAMMNLAGVLDRYATRLTFKVALRDIDEAFCREIEQLAKKHSGKVPLQAIVVDPEKSLVLTFNAPKLKVKVHDFMPELEKLEGVFDVKPTIVI
jgi:DNA polymerase-3 subunit alpha